MQKSIDATLQTEFIPATEPKSDRLMIILHGLGDSAAGFRWVPAALQLPWLNYLLVNAPDPYYGGFAWYDLGDPESGVGSSRKLLFELLDQLPSRGFPTAKTIFSGFSQGCLLSLEIGARYPHQFAGIVGISGYAHDPERILKEVSPVAKQQKFLITHGTQDPLLPIARVRTQMEMLRKGGLNIEWREFVKAHTIAGESEVSVIRDFIKTCYA